MQRTPVPSPHLTSVGYDARAMVLEVEFDSGLVFQYFEVPASIYQGLMDASSHGTYFDTHVKKAGFRYTRVL